MSLSIGEHAKSVYDYLTSGPVGTLLGVTVGGGLSVLTQLLFHRLEKKDKAKAAARSTIIKTRLIAAYLYPCARELRAQIEKVPKGKKIPKFTSVMPYATRIDKVTFTQDEQFLLLQTGARRLFDRIIDMQSSFHAFLDANAEYLATRREYFRSLPDEAFIDASGINPAEVPPRLAPLSGEMESIIAYWEQSLTKDAERAVSLHNDILQHYSKVLKITDFEDRPSA